jgi:2-haloacid dehalogenase
MLNFDSFEALTFDCYGTLIDWEAGIWGALRPVLAAHGVSETMDAALERFGRLESAAEAGPYQTYRSVLGQVLAGLGRELNFTPTPAELARFGGSVEDWPAFSDSAAALKALKRRYKLGIISNVDDDLFAFSNRRLDVTFDWIVTAQQAGSYKPSQHNFQVAFERLGLPREKILHVAQSLFHDHAPAKQLGLTTVWINRRHDKPGPGATPAADAQPDLELPDLGSLAAAIGLTQPGLRADHDD